MEIFISNIIGIDGLPTHAMYDICHVDSDTYMFGHDEHLVVNNDLVDVISLRSWKTVKGVVFKSMVYSVVISTKSQPSPFVTKTKKTFRMMDVVNSTSSNLTSSSQTSSQATVGVENLYPALIECFGIIGLGYVAGR